MITYGICYKCGKQSVIGRSDDGHWYCEFCAPEEVAKTIRIWEVARNLRSRPITKGAPVCACGHLTADMEEDGFMCLSCGTWYDPDGIITLIGHA